MTAPDLDLINPYLSERRQTDLLHAVLVLSQGIEAGRVKNQDFVGAKYLINRAAEDAVKKFDDAERAAFWVANPDAQIAPRHGVLFMGAHNIPAALKEMVKKGNEPRAALLRTLLPLNEMLQEAKPLIVKRGQGGPTEKQIAAAKAREGKAMHCQCCGRDIWAETGVIAHHGYERPGDGWQTESCMGARYLPFEVNRDRLGDLIEALKDHKARAIKHREETAAEKHAISETFTNHNAPRVTTYNSRYPAHPKVTLDFTRATFEAVIDANSGETGCLPGYTATDMKRKGFDHILTRELRSQDMRIKAVSEQLSFCEARYAGWKQTHEWKDKKWVQIEGSK